MSAHEPLLEAIAQMSCDCHHSFQIEPSLSARQGKRSLQTRPDWAVCPVGCRVKGEVGV